MDNQHRQIKGYRELNQGEIDLMNKIKTKGQELNELINEVKTHVANQIGPARETQTDAEVERLNRSEPMRWANIAKTDLQTGLMALTRAVAQPEAF